MKRAGQIVKTKTGAKGVIYNDEELIDGKVRVHLEGGSKMLCNLSNLTLKGFVDGISSDFKMPNKL